MTSSLATGSSHTRSETIARAKFDSQQWQPPQHWPTFSSLNPYNSGFYGNYDQAQHAYEFSQLQQTVKSLKEKLASVSSSSQKNEQVSHDDSCEVSRKKKRRVIMRSVTLMMPFQTSRLKNWMCGLVVKTDKRRMVFKCLHLMTCLMSKVVPIHQTS